MTAGVPVTPIDPALADDGVAEVLGVMYGGAPAWGASLQPGETFGVRMADTGSELLVELGKFSGTEPDSGKVYEDEDDMWLVDTGPEPVATITGTAADLDTWLWHATRRWRPGGTRVTGCKSRATGWPSRSRRDPGRPLN